MELDRTNQDGTPEREAERLRDLGILGPEVAIGRPMSQQHRFQISKAPKVAAGRTPEVRYATLTSGATELDEVVAQNASVHLEAMDDNHWWLAVEAGGQRWVVNLYTDGAPITAVAELEEEN